VKKLVAVGIALYYSNFTTGVVPLSPAKIHEFCPQPYRTADSLESADDSFPLFSKYWRLRLRLSSFSHSKENIGLVFLCGTIALVMALIVDLSYAKEGPPAATS